MVQRRGRNVAIDAVLLDLSCGLRFETQADDFRLELAEQMMSLRLL